MLMDTCKAALQPGSSANMYTTDTIRIKVKRLCHGNHWPVPCQAGVIRSQRAEASCPGPGMPSKHAHMCQQLVPALLKTHSMRHTLVAQLIVN